jgi:hypothetical protein
MFKLWGIKKINKKKSKELTSNDNQIFKYSIRLWKGKYS